MANHYSVLGLTKDASPEEVKKTYRALAKQYHPDKNQGDASSVDKFSAITTSYDAIMAGKGEEDLTPKKSFNIGTLRTSLSANFHGVKFFHGEYTLSLSKGSINGDIRVWKLPDGSEVKATIEYQPYPGYTVRKKDLLCSVTVKRRFIRKGKEISINNHPSLKTVKINLTKDIDHGMVGVYTGYGLIHSDDSPGDMYVTFNVVESIFSRFRFMTTVLFISIIITVFSINY